MDSNDVRVSTPVCTPRQLSELIGMPLSTVYSWMRPTPTRPALIHRIQPERRGWASIPLVGVAEASVLRPLRDGGMRMREISAAVTLIRQSGGEFALANKELLHDGVEALRRGRDGSLTRVLDGQGVFEGVLVDRLQPFRLAPDGFVEALKIDLLPIQTAQLLHGVEMDPKFCSGRMRFTDTGVPLFAIRGMLDAGEPAEAVARDFGIELAQVRVVEQADPAWLSQVA